MQIRPRHVTPDATRIALVVLGAFLLRAIALVLARNLVPIQDEIRYIEMAGRLLAEGDLGPTCVWPPGQPYLMAGVFSIFGENLLAVRAVQVALSTISVYFIYLVAQQVFGDKRTALYASVIAAIFPSLIVFSHFLWSETLFIFLLTAFIYTLLRSQTERSNRILMVSGCLFGLGCLTRTVLLAALPVALGYMAVRLKGNRRALIKSLTVFMVTFIITVAPWTIRNLRVHGSFILVSPNAGYNLWRGNSNLFELGRKPGDFSVFEYLHSGETAPERERYARAKGMEIIAADQPLWILKKAIRHLSTWRPDELFELRQIRWGYYGDMPGGSERFLVGLIRYVYLAIMLGAIVGLTWTKYNRERLLLLGITVSFMGVYLITLAGHKRMKVALFPVAAMFAAEGCRRLETRLRRRQNRQGEVREDGRALPGRTEVDRTIWLRAIIWAMATGLFIYISSVDFLAFCQTIFP